MEDAVNSIFQWVSIDVKSLLPSDWQETLLKNITNASLVELSSKSVTSRESHKEGLPKFLFVDGDILYEKANWLIELYRGQFLIYAKKYFGEGVVSSPNIRRAVVLNALGSLDMRYEAHIDSNPVTALLFVNTLCPGFGGELVVARDQAAKNVEEIEKNHIEIHPVSGMLHLFDGHRWPHYVRPIKSSGIVRASIVMNYYNDLVRESDRPEDLDNHLRLAQ